MQKRVKLTSLSNIESHPDLFIMVRFLNDTFRFKSAMMLKYHKHLFFTVQFVNA